MARMKNFSLRKLSFLSVPSVKSVVEFFAGYFGPFGGYAQQYLFHHARTTMPRGAK